MTRPRVELFADDARSVIALTLYRAAAFDDEAKWPPPRPGDRLEFERQAEAVLSCPALLDAAARYASAHHERDELVESVQRLGRALAVHAFDGEALSTREAIRSNIIRQGLVAMAEVQALQAELRVIGRERDDARAALDRLKRLADSLQGGDSVD